MNYKRNLIMVFFLLFYKVGMSQNVQPPSMDSIHKKEVKFINDLIQLQEYDQAINELKNLVLSTENELEKGYFYWLLYYSYSSIGDKEATAQNYQLAIQLYNSALNYLQINNQFLEAIDFIPFETYTSRGICYTFLKNYQTAISDYSRAISLNPKHGLAYFNRGVAYHKLGDINKACSDYLNADKYGFPVESRLIEGCNALK